MAARRQPVDILELRLVLLGVNTLIWRRLLVPVDASVADLHDTLQIAMDWEDVHLHRFHIRGRDMRSPNGPAYQKAETRHGLPLDYVAEKLRSSLESQHDLIAGLHAVFPEDLPAPSARSEATGDDSSHKTTEHDHLIRAATVSFHYQVTAWLGLNNMLGSAGPDQVRRLSRMSKVEFERWLDIVDKEGSVHGV